jgi:hypothetical protein
VEKAIFSITCTTCQARLVVRSEAAIGAILECPKCQSMVQVTPPPGWMPTPPPASELPPSVPGGPPPLDRVNAGVLTLELDPVDGSLLATLSRHLWLAWGAALAITLAILCGLWLAFNHRSATEEKHAVAEEKRPSIDTKRPVTAVAEGAVSPSPTPPESKPGDVPGNGTPTAKTVVPTPSPSTPAGRPAEVKRTEDNPFPFLADEAVRDAAKDAPPGEIKKSPLPQVDVAARMAAPLRGIELTDTPLVAAVDLMASMSTAPVTLDADALMQLGVAPGDPISLRLGSTTVGDALQAAAAERGLAVAIDGGQVLITSPAEYREKLRSVRYTVADLTGNDKAAVAELAALLRRLVAPESWQPAGGRGTIEPEGGVLVVVQTGEVHQQVVVFCEKLRNARKKPLRSRGNPERFTLATRLDQAGELLARPVTVNYHEPAPVAKILVFLAGAAGGDILIDRAALAAAETSDRVEAALTVEKQGLGQALTTLLRPLGLTYRALGPNLIQVTTREAAEERSELEFYRIDPWLDKGVPGPKLADALKARVAASTWSDAGGLGDVCFDPPSRCLIVLQSQPVQARIQRLLAIGPN